MLNKRKSHLVTKGVTVRLDTKLEKSIEYIQNTTGIIQISDVIRYALTKLYLDLLLEYGDVKEIKDADSQT